MIDTTTQTPDWSEAPERATRAGHAYWLRMWEDNVTGSHALAMFEDMVAILRMTGSVPMRLRAQADATLKGSEVDDDAFRAQIASMPIEDVVLPGHRSLLTRVTAMRPRTERLMFEVLLCRTVDTFLTYVADILALIFQARPETLRSDESVTLRQVLAHPSLDAFIAWYADRRINTLSYRGLDGIEKFISDRFGLSLVPTKELHERLNELIAVRNLLMHRAGRIDRRFLDTVGDRFGAQGENVNA